MDNKIVIILFQIIYWEGDYYNLIYEYENDCLTAAIEYNKNYYSDGTLKPDENILFSISRWKTI